MEPGNGRWLNPAQMRTVGVALTAVASLVIAGTALLCFFLLREFVLKFGNVIWPLAVAGILALLLRPLVDLLDRRLKLNRIQSVLLIYSLAILVLVGFVGALLPVLLEQIYDLVQALPRLLENAEVFLSQRWPEFHSLAQRILQDEDFQQARLAALDAIQKLGPQTLPALREFGAWVARIVTAATLLSIVPIYLFFFLLVRHDPLDDVERQLPFIPARYRQDLIFLAREFAGSLVAFFRGQILVGLITGTLLSIGFTAVGLQFGLFFGLLLGALNIIPYLGTIVGLGSALPTALFQNEGGLQTALLVLGVFVVVQTLESYLIAPRVMGKQTGLHPLTIIIAIFFWGTALDGLLGMVLAVPLTAFFIVAWRLVRRKYLPTEASPVTTP